MQKPLHFKLELPSNAKLVQGQQEETLTISEAGITTREFTLNADGALASPIVVTADMVDDKGVSLLRAQRRYPGPPEPSISSLPHPPPVPRPPPPPH
jgi:hypothetical protein